MSVAKCRRIEYDAIIGKAQNHRLLNRISTHNWLVFIWLKIHNQENRQSTVFNIWNESFLHFLFATQNLFADQFFISRINTTPERLKARNLFSCRYFSFYEQLKFRAQLS